ncbi:MAG: T9SS type A sorting domain-containing protein [Bacteroidota bacterium]|nr:T9SS type A sorting domain-containing protein [Bacteroidota bacterium]
MKKLIAVFVGILCLIGTPAKGQGILDSLRGLLCGLPRGDCNTNFLYELSPHITDESWYVARNYTDTNSTANWFQLYMEMSQSTCTPGTPIPLFQTVYDAAQTWIRRDTIPLGFMDFGFNMFRDDVFDIANKGIYLDWNDDSIWMAATNPTTAYKVNPYDPILGCLNEIFAVAPLKQSNVFRNVVFRWEGGIFDFYGPSANILPGDILQVNFGDGNGWITIPSPGGTNNYAITYPAAGTYIIEARVLRDQNEIKYSKSRIIITSNQTSLPPDEVWNFSNIEVGVYRACGHDSVTKPLIVLSGIDPLEQTSIEELYDEIIRDSTHHLAILRNYEYDYLIVDWKNSTRDMRENAEAVIELLEYLKCNVAGDEQYVIIGKSMGGVIGRYALTKMETQNYIDSATTCDTTRRQMHNTRLFITLDAAHDGAFIPLASQHSTDIALSMAQTNLLAFPAWIMASGAFAIDLMLDRPAMRQLLVQHRDTRNVNGEYTEHQERTNFMADLTGLNSASNGFPVHCKIMALSSGLMGAQNHQVGWGDLITNPGDLYLDLDVEYSVVLLRIINYVYLEMHIEVLVPEATGTSPILRGNFIERIPTFRGCLTQLLAGNPPNPPLCLFVNNVPILVEVTDVAPLDVMPGGRIRASGIAPPEDPEDADVDINWWVFQYEYQHNGAGGATFRLQMGVLFPLRVVGTVDAEMHHFNFIPIQSGLAYTLPPALGPDPDYNIAGDPVDTIMNRTPFDVVVAWPTRVWYPALRTLGGDNAHHSWIRSDELNDPRSRHFTYLTREIGEVEMYLDNLTISRRARFEAAEFLRAGRNMSLFYVYNGRPNPQTFLGGMYADTGGFFVDSGANVIFQSGQEIVLSPGFEARLGSRFGTVIDTMDVCYLPYEMLKKDPNEKLPTEQKEEKKADETGLTVNKLTVYPNPSEGTFTIVMPSAPEWGRVTLYTTDGREAAVFWLNGQQQGEIRTALPDGLYLLVVSTESGVFTTKIILNSQR